MTLLKTKIFKAKKVNRYGVLIFMWFALILFSGISLLFMYSIWQTGYQGSTLFYILFFLFWVCVCIWNLRYARFLSCTFELDNDMLIIKNGSITHKLLKSEVKNLKITDRIQFSDPSGNKFLITPDFDNYSDLVHEMQKYST